jgi:chitodextrinase
VTPQPTATPDLVAPEIPSDLSTAYASGKTVQLIWKPFKQSNEVLTYEIERNGQLIATTRSTSFDDTGLMIDTPYEYRVRAIDPSGNISGFSPVLSARTTGSIAREITIYYKTGFTNPHIHFKLENGKWTAWPGVPMRESEFNGYYKFMIPTGTSSKLEACFTNGSNQFDCKSGSNYKFDLGIYTFQYMSGSTVGTITSGAPNTSIVTPPPGGDTKAPTIPGTPNEEEVGYTYMKMKWSAATDDNKVASYAVYRNGVEIAQVTTTYFTDSGLAEDTYYTYRIQAIDTSGNRSALSKSMTKKTKDR